MFIRIAKMMSNSGSIIKSDVYIFHSKICCDGFNRVIVLATQSRAVLQTEHLQL